MNNTEERVTAIEDRNKRVEADKAWETSWFRIISLTIITYIIVTLVMMVIDVDRPYLNALIPTIGFFLSVQSLPILKKWWINKFLNK